MKSLLLFVRNPEPGKVKTRLARDVGPKKAAALYRRAAEENAQAMRKLPAHVRRCVFFTPPEGKENIRAWLGNGFSYRVQTGETLGRRLERAFEAALSDSSDKSEGVEGAAAVGSDTLGLTTALMTRALDGLASHDLVIGPAKDGGYYLIGMKKAHPELFENMPWSQSGLLEKTLLAADRLKLSVLRLPTLCDLDRVEDVPQGWM